MFLISFEYIITFYLYFIVVQKGKSPLQFAKESKNRAVVEILESHLQKVHNNLYY